MRLVHSMFMNRNILELSVPPVDRKKTSGKRRGAHPVMTSGSHAVGKERNDVGGANSSTNGM